jgi:Leucine-rich repeat (LRR) protein
MQALKGAIEAAKLLGVNPTDKDFSKSLESQPNMGDGKAVWEDWLYNNAVPALKNDIISNYGNDKRAKQLVKMLDVIVNDTKKTKEVKKKTASGTSYIIKG